MEVGSYAPEHKPAAGSSTGQAGRGRNQMVGGGAMDAFGMSANSWGNPNPCTNPNSIFNPNLNSLGGANDMGASQRQRGRQGGQQQGSGGVSPLES